MIAVQFDPWAELAVLENAECAGAPAKVAKPAKAAFPPVAPNGVPTEWVVGVARLSAMPRPTSVRRQRWSQAVRDARRFLGDWGAQASAFHWTTDDIYGCHPTHPVERVDCAGLVILLHGDEVIALTADAARIRKCSGALLVYPRRPRPGAVRLWELR